EARVSELPGAALEELHELEERDAVLDAARSAERLDRANGRREELRRANLGGQLEGREVRVDGLARQPGDVAALDPLDEREAGDEIDEPGLRRQDARELD